MATTREAINEALGKMTDPELRYVLQRCVGIRYGPLTSQQFCERFPELREPERVKSPEEKEVLEAHAQACDLVAKAESAYVAAREEAQVAERRLRGERFSITGLPIAASKDDSAEARRLGSVARERRADVDSALEAEVQARPHNTVWWAAEQRRRRAAEAGQRESAAAAEVAATAEKRRGLVARLFGE